MLFELHSSLCAGDTGRAVLALAALAYVAMLLSGLVLWWPRRRRQAFAVRTRSGTTVALLDLHRVAGAALRLLVLVSVVTGAYLAWRPIAGWVTTASGQSPRPVTVPRADVGGTPSASVDAALLRAQAHWPGAQVSVVHVPPRSLAAARARLRLLNDPHPIGMSTVWLEPASGRVRDARHWSDSIPATARSASCTRCALAAWPAPRPCSPSCSPALRWPGWAAPVCGCVTAAARRPCARGTRNPSQPER